MLDVSTVIRMWANADTNAMLAFLPIKRRLVNREELDLTELRNACSWAALAADLRDALDAEREASNRRSEEFCAKMKEITNGV